MNTAAQKAMYGGHWKGRQLDSGDIKNFRRNGMSAGLDGHTHRDGTTKPQIELRGMELLLMMAMDMCGKEFFEKYYYCGVGNPHYQDFNGWKLTTSDILAVHNAWQILRYAEIPQHIVEIGPGYGALSAVLRKLYPDTKITLIDLPEHHEMQAYYLENTVGLDGFEITTELPNDADLVIALRCMMEMPAKEVNRYFDWMQSLETIKLFYLINRYIKSNVLKQYPFDNRWIPLLSKSAFFQTNIHEFILARTEEESDLLQLCLNCLPPYFIDNTAYDYRPGIQHYDTTKAYGI